MGLKSLDNLEPWEWPEDAAQMISRVLIDKNVLSEERLLAAELAGNEVVMSDDMADQMIGLLEDKAEEEELRCKLAIALGPALAYCDMMEFDDPDDLLLSEDKYNEVKESLRRVHEDRQLPRDLRRRALEASVRAPEDWHDEAVKEALKEGQKDHHWLLTAVFSMGYIKDFEKEIVMYLDHENDDVAFEAVCAAGNQGVEEAWPFIEKILKAGEEEKEFLIAAIYAAASINQMDAADYILEYSNSNDADIAEAAEDAMGMGAFFDFDDEVMGDDDDDDWD